MRRLRQDAMPTDQTQCPFLLMDNAEEWEADQILDYRHQHNRHEFRVHWKG